jgi:uncharacterized Zn-binding protein involved in type VI secretion
MSGPAVVAGDQITGQCATHQIPSPTGAPVPGPPMPFSAPLTNGLAATVLIEGKPAAVAGANGFNTPPHVGLHGTDPFMAPPAQMATVTGGSSRVTFEGRPAAYTGCPTSICFQLPGQVMGSASSVLVGS